MGGYLVHRTSRPVCVRKMHIYFVLCLRLFSAANRNHTLGVLFKKNTFFFMIREPGKPIMKVLAYV